MTTSSANVNENLDLLADFFLLASNDMLQNEGDLDEPDDIDLIDRINDYWRDVTEAQRARPVAALTAQELAEIEEMADRPIGHVRVKVAEHNRQMMKMGALYHHCNYHTIAGLADLPEHAKEKGKNPPSLGWNERLTPDLDAVHRNFTTWTWNPETKTKGSKARDRSKDRELLLTDAVKICLITGQGLAGVVFDIDGAIGRKTLQEAEAKYGKLPMGPKLRSGSGKGFHLVTCINPAHVPEGVTIHQGQGSFFKKGGGLDTRLRGGQIVVHPSGHKSGGVYGYFPGRALWHMQPPELPKAWVDALIAFSKKTQAEIAAKTGQPMPKKSPAQKKAAAKRRELERHEGDKFAAAAAAMGGARALYGYEDDDDDLPGGYLNRVPQIGYGDGTANGCHGPINTAALSFYAQLGTDEPVDELVALIRERLVEVDKQMPGKLAQYDGLVEEMVEAARQHAIDEGFPVFVPRAYGNFRSALTATKPVADGGEVDDGDKIAAGKVARNVGATPGLSKEEIQTIRDELCPRVKEKHRVGLDRSAFNDAVKEGGKHQWKDEDDANESSEANESISDAPDWLPDEFEFEDGKLYSTRKVRIGENWVAMRDKFVCTAFEPIALVTTPKGTPAGLRVMFGGRDAMVSIASIHASKDHLATDLHKGIGLECGTGRDAHDAVAEIMRCAMHKEGLSTIVEVTEPGWHFGGNVFVCANGRVVGTAPDGATVRLADGSGYPERAPDGMGSPDAESAVYAKVWQQGPPLWRFMDLWGLASACLDVVGCRSGSVALDGFTRHGKTTGQHVQTARAGSPDEADAKGGLIPFNPSPEAAEIPLRNATSNPFAMDELQNVRDPRELQRFIFVMAGGSGKLRMKRSADAMRDQFRWRVLSSISTERGIADTLKSVGKAMVGGLVARCPSLAVSDLCDHTDANGELAQEIKRTLFASYGHTFPDFVGRALIGVDRTKAAVEWRELVSDLAGDVAHLKAPAEFFALCWWAGKQAARIGLTDGLTDAAVAETVKAAWQDFAGREESRTLQAGAAELDTLREYIATHLDRTIVATTADAHEGTYQDRTGYYDADYYYLLASVLDTVSGGTGNRQAVLKALKVAKALILPKAGKSGDLTFTSIPGVHGKARHYRLLRSVLDQVDDVENEPAQAPEPADPIAAAAHDIQHSRRSERF